MARRTTSPVRLEGLHSPEELLAKLAGRVPSEPDPDRPSPDRPTPGKPGRDPKKPGQDDDGPDGQPPQPRPGMATTRPRPRRCRTRSRPSLKRNAALRTTTSTSWNATGPGIGVSRAAICTRPRANGCSSGEVAAGGDAELRLTDSARHARHAGHCGRRTAGRRSATT